MRSNRPFSSTDAAVEQLQCGGMQAHSTVKQPQWGGLAAVERGLAAAMGPSSSRNAAVCRRRARSSSRAAGLAAVERVK
ncbi:hypothetical protein [Paenibacillus arenilitoris]|uniref:Uncharacterized protein n=1 Tax=Paenibacillus arenilitoris TaxID=2772299 RepID=A0A927CHH6_9BACL|nr:hypothetical protein [Paenibacillus arenilitoris]MBD2868183.1 hypothetical protein [Paenibacillus arenilitoris]